MERREALRLLAAGTALHLAPLKLRAALRAARRLVDQQTAPRTLNSHQYATVKLMAELLIPKTDTLGATDVGVSDFIDLMLTEWYDEASRTLFVNGLAETDSRTKTLFGRDFVGATPDQQADVLIWLGEKMAVDAEPMPRRFSRSSGAASKNFYGMFRNLTLTAYYTSEAGATDELHFQIIPDSHAGCAEIPSAKRSAENQ